VTSLHTPRYGAAAMAVTCSDLFAARTGAVRESLTEEVPYADARSRLHPGAGALRGSHTANPGLHARQARDGADGGFLNSHPSHQTNEPDSRMAPSPAHLGRLE
jgi:hypothetical protein